MVRFTDLHRVYLQALLSRRFIPENVALQLYKRADSAIRGMSFEHSSGWLQRLINFTETRPDYEPPFSESRKGLQSFVDEIGEGIAELGLQVTVTRDETKEGRLWICLVSVLSLRRLRLSLNHDATTGQYGERCRSHGSIQDGIRSFCLGNQLLPTYSK